MNDDFKRAILPTVALTSTILGGIYVYRTHLRRVPTAAHVTPQWFHSRSLFGKVVSVGDADNFRVFHTPGGRLTGWGWLRKELSSEDRKVFRDQTIHVRLAGVDAPEMAHFNKPKQPYSDEAYAFLTAYVLDRRVRIWIYSRDRFERVVGRARVWRYGIPRDVGLAMIKAGLATVYEAKTGAEYGGREDWYRRAQAKAQRKRRGMWASKDIETPREYKTRTRSE
jgi:endonuclease YncB( thermonuclease family)